jgi:putative ABC transport system permease protein
MNLRAENLREAFQGDWVPLALRNLVADPKRMARAVAGIGFASLLMLMQLGFKHGFLESALQFIHVLDGEIFLVSHTKYHFGETDTFPRRRLYQAAEDPAVLWARPLYAERRTSIWKNPESRRAYAIQVLAFDPDEPVFTLPEVAAHLEAIKTPNTLLIDSRSRSFIGATLVDDRPATEIASRMVKVVGAFALGPDFTVDGTAIMSDRNFLLYFPQRAGGLHLTRVDIGVVKLAPGTDPEAVARRLAARLPDDVQVLTRQGLLDLETRFQLDVSNVGPIFLLGTGIGFVVGMLISYQILFNDISDQLPQYATLKAIGYGDGYLLAVVLQQSVFYAIASYVPAAILAAVVFHVIGEIVLLPMEVTPAIVGGCAALAVGMCVVAGVAAVRRVFEADPAEVF